MLNAAQLGGYDIDEGMEINGKNTISLKDLVIDGVPIKQDILVTQLPHPTRLSMMTAAEAKKTVKNDLAKIAKDFRDGPPKWKIEPADLGFENRFDKKEEYEYKRGDMGPEYYDFGAPNSRMVNVSSASRLTRDTIVFGTRGEASFNGLAEARLRENCHLVNGKCQRPPDNEMWIMRPNQRSNPERFFKFDPGPGMQWARVLKESLPSNKDNADDVEFYKQRDTNGDFGHYRGTFKNPRVVIIADPHGEDDLITSRALTGSRGQYLHSLMEDLKIGDKYLVIKTAPFSQDTLWDDTVKKTRNYRLKVFNKLFSETKPEFILLDGPSAQAEFKEIMKISPTAGGLSSPPTARVIEIKRTTSNPEVGIKEAFDEITNSTSGVSGFTAGFKFTAKRMVDIPRSHLSYYARVWEGTSGDRVLPATDPENIGKAFAEVIPGWVLQQVYPMPDVTVADCNLLYNKLNRAKLRMGGELLTAYEKRFEPSGTVKSGRNRCQSIVAEGLEGGVPTDSLHEQPNEIMTKDKVDPELSHVEFYEAPLESN